VVPDFTIASVVACPVAGGPLLACARAARRKDFSLPLLSKDQGVSWQEPVQIGAAGRFTGPGEFRPEALSFHPAMAGIALAGIDRELMRSTDGGLSWEAWGRGFFGWRCEGSAWAARPPLDRDRVWLAMGAAGLWAADAAGGSARQVLRTQERCVAAVCHPDPATPLALTWWERGTALTLRRSADGGATWQDAIGAAAGRATFAFHPIRGQVIFAGRFVSENGGQSFRPLPVDVIAAFGRTGETVYGVDAQRPWACMRSTDGGATWLPFGGDVPGRLLCAAVDPLVPERLFIGTTAGLYRAGAQGSWEPLGLADHPYVEANVTAILVDAGRPGWMRAAVADPWSRRGGVLASDDGGETWRLAVVEQPVTGLAPWDRGATLAATDVGLFVRRDR
jgi:hypothetical protein